MIKCKTLLKSSLKNKSQRVNDAFKNEQYDKALKLADDSLSKGSAEYKLENYEDALKSFSTSHRCRCAL